MESSVYLGYTKFENQAFLKLVYVYINEYEPKLSKEFERKIKNIKSRFKLNLLIGKDMKNIVETGTI